MLFWVFLVFLAAFAQFGMAVQVGSVHIISAADGALSMLNRVHSADGHRVDDPSYSTLPKGSQYLFHVEDGMDVIATL